MGFENFRKRGANGTVSSLLEKIQKADEKKDYSNNEFYYPNIDDGKGAAIIRFLPPKETELPFVTVYSHKFKGDDGRWVFVDLCPTTLGKDCPVCNINRELWNTEKKENQQVVRERKRQKKYVFNIFVVKDVKNPENEGKVFPYMCGSVVYNKILSSMEPTFGDDAIDPFDLYTGHNFLLQIKRDPSKGNMITYDDCKFDQNPSQIAPDDKLEAIYNSMVDLNKYISEDKLPDEVQLARKLSTAYSSYSFLEINKPLKEEKPKTFGSTSSNVSTSKTEVKTEAPWNDVPETTSETLSGSEDDDDMEFFKQLAQS